MSELSDLYRRYRISRKRDSKDTSTADDSALDEVDALYRQYRRDRDPDFEKSISRVMHVAREKIDTENAAAKILDKANELSVTPLQTDTSPTDLYQKESGRSGLFTTLFNAPRQLVDALGGLVKTATTNRWTKIALPACAVAVVAVSTIGYIETRQDNHGYDLAFLKSDAIQNSSAGSLEIADTLSGYIDASPVVSLGFTNVQDEAHRAFQLGRNSIDLQVATLAEKGALVDLSNRRLSDLLIAGRDATIIDGLTDLRENPEADYRSTTELLSAVSSSVETSKRWFEWGRDTQSVFYSSQLALDSGTVEPMRKSLKEFENRFQLIGESDFSAPEVSAVRKILSLVNQPEYTTGNYRVIRDSARDLIALRTTLGN